jgi:2-methylisocitrate lyase-like PEP mutase family enzyme
VEQIRAVVSSVDRPVNVLALPGVPPVSELAELGVARISVGSGFALTALGALVEAGREFLDEGSYGFWQRAGLGRDVARKAFS